MALIAFDARDAFVPMPHGSGIYVRRLLEALGRRALAGHELWPVLRGGRGPELWWEQVTFPRQLRSRGAGLVHSPDSFLPLRRPCPGVVTVHDLAFEAIPNEMRGATAWKYRTFLSRAARSAERIICPSRFTAQDVSERYGIEAERIRVIPEAPALAPGAQPSPEGPYLLSAGDLRPKKNLPLLIEAYLMLRRGGLEHRLLIAGADLGIGGELRRLARGEPVELLGFVSDERLDALMRGADALIVPSLYEGFGLIVLDAMQRGCPVVLARAGALPETGGSAAAYFDPHDADELAAAVGRVVGDRREGERLAELGRSRAREFSWEKSAAATAAVYDELLS
jgi:glycosyltransferase involved in cell wall biosynthesis